jgi:hypothetical protein
MITKLISILAVLVVLFCGYHFYQYWVKVRDEEELKRKEAATAFSPERLPGVPPELEQGLRAVQQKGPAAVQSWLKTYGSLIQDPRKAWIELEYAKAIVRDNPAAARKIFNDVRDRTPPASPLWPHLKAVEKSFQ